MPVKKNNSNKTRKRKPSEIRVVHSGESIFRIAHYVHHTVARHCDYCGKSMSPSDVNDFGSLCERCYMKEYYGK